MSIAKSVRLICTFLSLFLVAIAGFGISLRAQNAPSVRFGGVEMKGFPADWSTRHVIFSNPGTEQEAIEKGQHRQWQRIANDPRYVTQQLRKNLPIRGPAAVDAEYRRAWLSEITGTRVPSDMPPDDASWAGKRGSGSRFAFSGRRPVNPESNIHRDWRMSLGGTGLAASQYPAKYSWDASSASCSDYIVFPTGAAGTSSQATIVAFNNIYVGATGGCAGHTANPSVYWAFDTPPGGVMADTAMATLSPTVSWDGSEVAFVETYNCTAFLVILRMAAAGSAYNPPAYPGSELAHFSASAFHASCTPSTAPCYTTLSLGHNDTGSAPFYVYSGVDTLYIGDDCGYVHEVTGVFNGTPTVDPANSDWPVRAANSSIDTNFASAALTAPIYDSDSPNYVFVNDASGYLHSITTSGAPALNGTSAQMTCNPGGFVDAPVVDSTGDYVYVFVGEGCDGTPGNSYINRFPDTSPVATYGTPLSFCNASTNTSTSTIRAGDFDNEYYNVGATSGHAYVCENGRVYRASTGGNMSEGVFDTLSGNGPSNSAVCSPVTEFVGSSASTTLVEAINHSAEMKPSEAQRWS